MSTKNRIVLIEKVSNKFGKYSEEHRYCLFADDKTLKNFCKIFF